MKNNLPDLTEIKSTSERDENRVFTPKLDSESVPVQWIRGAGISLFEIPIKISVALVPLFTAILLLAAGCATQNKAAKKNYYFFPPPPDEPHLQFLTAFSSERDLRGGHNTTFRTYLTGETLPSKEIGKPYGAAAHDKKLYVCDTDLAAVLVVDWAKNQMHMMGAQGEGTLKVPLNIAIDSDGTSYVADSGREQVVIFDQNENFVSAMGKIGEMKPRDVALGKDRIYVADLLGRCVRVFDKATRAPLFSIPKSSDAKTDGGQLFTPTNLALDSQGNLYVADTGAFCVRVYDADGNYVRTVGGAGDGAGQFARVKGIAVDRQNRLYAVDAMSQVVQIFNDKGQVLTYFGEPLSGPNIQNLPAKVLVDYDDIGFFQNYAAPGFQIDHLVIVINQLGSHKVSVYGFGQKK
ncbi:MAG TPA: 6-bladed beta-propeller [Verrucomicrobiae bacterium]|nr:6-bladed beta-propeller [Verrucomicrobiae bacterium]